MIVELTIFQSQDQFFNQQATAAPQVDKITVLLVIKIVMAMFIFIFWSGEAISVHNQQNAGHWQVILFRNTCLSNKLIGEDWVK